jgi:hypothetical protein
MWRFAQTFLDAAPKAHPKVTNDNWALAIDHFLKSP